MAMVKVLPDAVTDRKVLKGDERYLLEVQKASMSKSPKGNDTLKIEMVVMDGPDQEWGSPMGYQMSKTIWVDARSRDLKNALEAFNIKTGPNGWDSDDFVTRQAWATVVVRIYDGDPINDIRKFFPAEA